MGITFNLNVDTLYKKSNRDYKELSGEELKKEYQKMQEDKKVYQDVIETDSNGNKKVFKNVTFRDPKNPDELITVRLTQKNINNLKNKFGEDNFIKRDNGTIRLTKKAEEFVSTWFEDVKYNRGFKNRGADFNIEYDYLDKKLGGEISSVSVEMSEQYLNLGKMKYLSQKITSKELEGLTEKQKKEIEDDVKRANVMIEYFKKYINIFEADGGTNLTDELNTTLRIDKNFDGKIDLNENFKRKEDSTLTAESFFTNLANDYNEKYSNENFSKKDFEKDKDIDFMSFADKEELLDKIRQMTEENKKSPNHITTDEIYESIENMENKKNEVSKKIVADVMGGTSFIKGNWDLTTKLLFNNRYIEETSKKVDNEEIQKQNKIKDEMDKNLTKLFGKNGNFSESKRILQSIVNTYNDLYRNIEVENFTKKLHDDYENVEDFELNSEYKMDYNAYLGTKDFLINVQEYQKANDYSNYYVTTREFQKEFFKGGIGEQNTPFSFAKNFVKAKSSEAHVMEAKFKNVRAKMMSTETSTEFEQNRKNSQLQMVNTIIDTFSKF